jgi:hypothetical protein
MGHDSERAALIYQHQALGADEAITNPIDGRVKSERTSETIRSWSSLHGHLLAQIVSCTAKPIAGDATVGSALDAVAASRTMDSRGRRHPLHRARRRMIRY